MNTKKKLDELRKYTDISKFDINARVQMIIDEIQQQLAKWEQEARAIYYPESQVASKIIPTEEVKNDRPDNTRQQQHDNR